MRMNSANLVFDWSRRVCYLSLEEQMTSRVEGTKTAITCKANRFNLAVRMYLDNALRKSKRGKIIRYATLTQYFFVLTMF